MPIQSFEIDMLYTNHKIEMTAKDQSILIHLVNNFEAHSNNKFFMNNILKIRIEYLFVTTKLNSNEKQ